MTNPLAPLAALRQFIAVRLVPLPDGKTNKLPLDLQGNVADAHVPAHWQSWAEAHALATRLGPGHSIGFVITAGCGFVCLDIDGCIKPDGTYTQIVHDLAAQLGTGVVWELSQSRKGLHLWMRGTPGPHASKNTAAHLEAYSQLRFICLGEAFAGNMDAPCPGLDAVLQRYFPASAASAATVDWDPNYRHPEWVGPPLADDEVVRLCGNIKSPSRVFGSKATFQELMAADDAVMAKYFPSSTGDVFDRSSADLALFSDLAWATGHNAVQMDRIARTSGLAREKWDERSDYVPNTVTRAVTGSGCYKAKPSAVEERQAVQHLAAPVGAPARAEPERHVPTAVAIAGRSFATREDQMKLFAGCVYVVDQHRVLTPDGRLLRPEQFRALHGGYSFMMGGPKGKTTNSAWEAFTENQDIAFPRVQSTCFRPDLPFGTVEDGRVNTFVAPNVRMVAGDATPFLNHLRKLLPREDDATVLLSYLAACVQYPGKKFQWAPVLQGVEGNGKTFFSTVAAYAVGERFVHWPKASKLVKTFNAWMVGKMLYCVEDIYLPNVGGDVVMEELKPMITGGRGLEIEGKGVDQYSADICGNFIINTNHKDGLRKSANDRRYAMLYCAQQDQHDLKRDFGDSGAYMRALYEWLDFADGKAICAHYLAQYQIPERFDPTRGAPRAPITSSTDEAVTEGLGMVEQLVLEAIEEGKQGFRGGWVSTTFLKILLEASGKDRYITPARRKTLMKTLGFVPHPGMHYGRVHNVVQPDNAQPVLFVRIDSAQCMPGAAPAEIAKAYSAAQA